jgi:starch phosphorylase
MNLRAQGYRPRDYYDSNERLREVIDAIANGAFSNGDRDLFSPLVRSLLETDEYLLFADYQSYIDEQVRAGHTFGNIESWTRMSILNVARMGYFSSDRSIQEYCDRIWDVKPVKVEI